MKVLHVVRQYLPGMGGMETYVSCLCRQSKALGIDTVVATLNHLFRTSETLPAYERIDGTEVIRLKYAGNPRYFMAPGLLRLLPRYDIVHVHGVDFFVDMLGFLKIAHGKPLVVSTHGGFFHTGWLLPLKKAYFQTVTRAALMGVDRVLASSPQDEKIFLKICNRVSLVENGIDYEKFASVKKDVQGNTIMFIGRLSQNKRIDRLIDVLAYLKEWLPDIKLLIAGPDWEGLQEALKQQASQMGLADAVEFTGGLTQEELLKELAGAKLFVSASQYEAFGLSTVEAMASGTVPVVNHIQAFADIIETGETGFLTDFSRPQAAAAMLKDVLELSLDELNIIGAKAKERAACFSWPQVAKQIVQIYEQVLSKDGARV